MIDSAIKWWKKLTPYDRMSFSLKYQHINPSVKQLVRIYFFEIYFK